MPEEKEDRATPSVGPILPVDESTEKHANIKKEVSMIQARVGKTAPDFELSAFFEGGFKNIRLSDFKGKWIVVCFYPGDFTFV